MCTRKFLAVVGINLLLVALPDFAQSISANQARLPLPNGSPLTTALSASPEANASETTDSSSASSRTGLPPMPDGDARSPVVEQRSVLTKPPDLNRDIYYKNKLELGVDGGCLPINIPFPFDFMMGDHYNTYPLKYTLVPVIVSLRWHMGNVKGPWAFRGNWDLTASGSITGIPRGPETRYFSYMMALRRNFVQRNWKAAPYFDWRAGEVNKLR